MDEAARGHQHRQETRRETRNLGGRQGAGDNLPNNQSSSSSSDGDDGDDGPDRPLLRLCDRMQRQMDRLDRPVPLQHHNDSAIRRTFRIPPSEPSQHPNFTHFQFLTFLLNNVKSATQS